MDRRECRVEVFSRVVGFFRPVQAWNKGKTEEFKDRDTYRIDGMLKSPASCACVPETAKIG